MLTPLRKNQKVRLIQLPERDIERLKIGMIGKILAVRITDGHVLVKWVGRSGPVSHEPHEVEQIP